MKLTKAEARKMYLEKRKLEQHAAEYSLKIKDLLFSRLKMHRFSPIHVFLPIVKNHEVDTWPIIETLRKDFAPEIFVSKSLENGELLHFELKADMILTENKWGIPEPEQDFGGLTSAEFFEKYKTEDILVLIPLLIFDKKGHRVGYGKGFYDRFLQNASIDTIKVGLCFYEPIEEILDILDNDIRLDYCITSECVWKF